jgi:UDP-N-acetyl-D-mannosaminuronate dehydrogenase
MRKPEELVATKVRMPEQLRRTVEQRAKKSGRSFSGEVVFMIGEAYRADESERRLTELKDAIEREIAESAAERRAIDEKINAVRERLEGRVPLQLDDLRASLRQMQACILDTDDTSVMIAVRISRQTIKENRQLLSALIESGLTMPGRPEERAVIEDRTKAATES